MYKKLTSVLVAMLVLLAPCVQASTTVIVTVLKDGQLAQKGVGALVADEVLVIDHLLVTQGDQVQVRDSGSGALLVGTIFANSTRAELALISVKGLTGTPFELAKLPLEVGNKMYLQVAGDVYREGTVHSILPADDTHPYARVQHTVPVEEGEYGAPILNNCKELAGVSQNQKRGLFNFKLTPSVNFGIASELEVLKKFLSEHKVAYIEIAEQCLSEQEMIAKLADEQRKQEDVIAEAEKDKQAKAAAIDKLEKDKQAKEKALQEAEQANKDKEQELKDAYQLKQEQDAELKKVAEEKAKQAERIAEIEAQQAEKETERKAEQEEQLYIMIGTAVVIGLFVIAVIAWMTKRKKQLHQAKQQSESIEHELSVEKAKYESVQGELKLASATFHDILFLGKDDGGTEQRVKIVGSALARSPQGVILGRSVQTANFVLNVSGVGREHLKLRLVDGLVTVEDMGSVNGSAVNGKVLIKGERAPIHNGDELRVGTVNGRVHFLS